ncbi:hypothetical protein [Bradyrhizobium cenepequi]|uniref:hypothetical protein n=1 Tax=Bradyrhizobium cenepequi TaxID=2821403 RepID=UPI00289BB4C9|nr:hypothetical protein [Bradyrhizobium cenepequi]
MPIVIAEALVMRSSPSIIPGADRDIYLVLDDHGRCLGRAWPEMSEEDTDRETLLRHLMEGQYHNPIRIVSFNTSEGWWQDASEEIAAALRRTRRGPADAGGLSGTARPPRRYPAFAALTGSRLTDLAAGRPAPSHKPDPLDAPAFLAAILNDVLAVVAGATPLEPHRLLADDAGNQREQRGAIVIHGFLSTQSEKHELPFIATAVFASVTF